MPEQSPGYELPLLLFAGFRSLIDDLHAELARQGHPDVRPAYGFALQAIGADGCTASELGRRLGISKQAAGKTIEKLVGIGYAERADDETDGRRKLIRITPRGHDSLIRAARIFQDLHDQWTQALGARRMRDLEDSLRQVVPAGRFALDVAGWFGAS